MYVPLFFKIIFSNIKYTCVIISLEVKIMKYDILVNYSNPIDMEYYKNIIIPSLVPIDFQRDNSDIFVSHGIKENKIYLESNTAEAWLKLRNYVRTKGIIFDICSGFLSLKQQENKYNDFLARNGQELTKQRIALPTYSEHHTGLALDCDFYINEDWAGISPDEFGNDKPETKFIHNILPKFGFILRYPRDKVVVTNIQYEPWHIRYVGVELAKEITDKGFTLEEYHDDLMKNSKKEKSV